MNIYDVTYFLWIRNLRTAQLIDFSSRLFKMPLWALIILTGQRICFQDFHSHSCWPEASIPHRVDSSISFLSVFMIQQWTSLRARDPRKSKAEEAMSFMTQFQKSHSIISTIFYQLHKSALFSVWEDYTRARIQRGGNTEGHLGGWSPCAFIL